MRFVGIFLLLILTLGCTNTAQEAQSPSSEIETAINEKTMVIKSGQVFYSGGSPDLNSPADARNYHWQVSSDVPVQIYIVLSEADFKLIGTEEEFHHYPTLRGINILDYDKYGTIEARGGIAIFNKEEKDATVHLKISQVS